VLIGGGTATALLFPRAAAVQDKVYATARIPLIVTKMESKTDGFEYNVQTLFSVRIDKAVRSQLTIAEVRETLVEIMKDVDVDELKKANGVEYVNQFATTALNKALFSEESDTLVFVSDIFIGDRVKLKDVSNAERDQTMKGLFQKIN